MSGRNFSLSLCLVLLALLSACGKPLAPSELQTQFLSAKGGWTAHHLLCFGKGGRVAERRPPLRITLAVKDHVLGGTLSQDRCTASWSSRIHHVLPSTVRVRDFQMHCPSECDAKI